MANDVTYLVAGPAVSIGDRCVVLCTEFWPNPDAGTDPTRGTAQATAPRRRRCATAGDTARPQLALAL